MQKVVGISWLAAAALCGVLAFASNPAYYLWATVTLLFVGVAYANLAVPRNKRALVLGYVAAAVYGFVLGRTMFTGGRLTSAGVLAILVAVPFIGYFVWRLYKSESAAA